MKKHSCVDVDQLLESYCQIEKKFSDMNGKNSLLESQLEKTNRMWKLSHGKETDYKKECAALQKVVKGLQETIQLQCNIRDENLSLKKRISILEEELHNAHEGYKCKVDLLMSEIKSREEVYKAEMKKIHCDMSVKLKLKEEESNNLLLKKEAEIAEITKKLQNKEKEKQSEMIKQQIEFSTKLAKIQNKPEKLYPNSNTLSKNIYRMKLQHLQEEKNKEIESLCNKIKDLEKQINSGSVSLLKRKRC
ncbi:hypothetical protein GDO86_002450 [Hymenochirus boettgeri]|uniref:Coiled-coil domain-containing protein 152 n=1 Tax=Hymenochirus boettgeri TaxID=247094 RepID=A0A8T2KMM0_9PIPI|nr:hypothetical protein GDO86_002450 [Hymenochirus boettgeri]